MISDNKPTTYSKNTNEWGYLLKNGLKLFIAIRIIIILFTSSIITYTIYKSLFWFFYYSVFDIFISIFLLTPLYLPYICALALITKTEFKSESFKNGIYLLTFSLILMLLVFYLTFDIPEYYKKFLEKKSIQDFWEFSIKDEFTTISFVITHLIYTMTFYFLIHRPFINKINKNNL